MQGNKFKEGGTPGEGQGCQSVMQGSKVEVRVAKVLCRAANSTGRDAWGESELPKCFAGQQIRGQGCQSVMQGSKFEQGGTPGEAKGLNENVCLFPGGWGGGSNREMELQDE